MKYRIARKKWRDNLSDGCKRKRVLYQKKYQATHRIELNQYKLNWMREKRRKFYAERDGQIVEGTSYLIPKRLRKEKKETREGRCP